MSMKSQLISIIIPVYNVQNYIHHCIQSVLCQTYEHFEALLIDDGSTDESGRICDYYAKLDSRVKVIHKNNGGVSSARNIGIDNSEGQYIVFVDADDWIEQSYLEILINSTINNQADLAYCSYTRDTIYTNVAKDNFSSAIKYKLFSINDAEFWFGRKRAELWTAIYSRNVMGELRFDEEIAIGEDSLFLLEYAKKCNKILYVSSKLYHYYQRNDSAMHVDAFDKSALSVLDAQKRLFDLFSNNRSTLLLVKAAHCGKCWALISRFYNNKDFQQSYYKFILTEFKNNLPSYLRIRSISFFKKLKLILFVIMPKLYFTIKRKNKAIS